jgi:hypothetical protein
MSEATKVGICCAKSIALISEQNSERHAEFSFLVEELLIELAISTNEADIVL